MPPDADDMLAAAFVLLSLDVGAPFLDEMGLRVSEASLVRGVIRRCWKAHDHDRRLQGGTARSALQAISNEFGHATATAVSDWVSKVFARSPSDQPHWSAWEAAFHMWAFGDSGCPALAPGTEDELLADYRVSLSLGEIEGLLDHVRQAPLSEWDHFVYQMCEYSDDDEIASPLMRIEFVIELCRFQEFWARWSKGWSPDERHRLHESAAAVARQRQYSLPEPLFSPDQMTQMLGAAARGAGR
jgi:hypothetical protein